MTVKLVGASRFELLTPGPPCQCATRLRHAPILTLRCSGLQGVPPWLPLPHPRARCATPPQADATPRCSPSEYIDLRQTYSISSDHRIIPEWRAYGKGLFENRHSRQLLDDTLQSAPQPLEGGPCLLSSGAFLTFR